MKYDRYGHVIREPMGKILTAEEMLRRAQERLSVIKANCPLCGLEMTFTPFCGAKSTMGYVGRFNCPGCKKIVFLDDEQYKTQYANPK